MGRIDFSKYGGDSPTTTAPKTGGRVDFSKYKDMPDISPQIQEPQISPKQVQLEKPKKAKLTDVIKEILPATKKVGKTISDLLIGGVKKVANTAGEIAFTATPEYKKLLDEVSKGKVKPEVLKEVAPVLGKTNTQLLGELAEAGLDVATLGVGGIAVKGGIKATQAGVKLGIKQLAKRGAKAGAEIGAGYGTALGLQEEKPTVSSVIKRALGGGAIGAGAGAVLTPLLSKLTTKLGKAKLPLPEGTAQKLSPDYYKQLIGEELQVISPLPSKRNLVSFKPTQIRTGDKIFNKDIGIFTVEKVTKVPTKGAGGLFLKPTIILRHSDGSEYSASLQDLLGFKKITTELQLPKIREVPTRKVTKKVEIIRPAKITDITETPNLVKTIRKSSQPFSPTSREKHFEGYLQDTINKIEKDSQYLDRLNQLGGGRTVTHTDTLINSIRKFKKEGFDKAFNRIAEIKQGQPVSEIDIGESKIIFDYLENKLKESQRIGNIEIARETIDSMKKFLPGFNNVGATGGRTAEAMKLFKEGSDIFEKVSKLVKKGASYDEFTKELAEPLTRFNTLKKSAKIGLEFIRTVENYATGAKLTSLITHSVNTISNLANWAQRGGEKIVVAGQQLIKGRPKEAIQTARFAFGRATGFLNGLRKFGKTLIAEPAEIGKDLTKAELGRGTLTARLFAKLPKPIQVAGRVVSPFRWLAAADNFWKAVISDSELAIKAYQQATKEGLKGNAFAQRTTELLNKPPSGWLDDAMKVAREYTFQENPDKLLEMIMKMRNVPGGRFILPFVQTPYNIWKFQFRRSPLGILSIKNIQDIIGSKALLKSERVASREEAFARLLVGSGLSIGGVVLAFNTEITGAYPTEPSERALWQAENKKAWTIKIGNKWVQYNRFQPLGLYLAQAAILKDLYERGDFKKYDSSALQFLTLTSQYMEDAPFLSGLSSLTDLISDPIQNAENFRNLVVQGFFPTALRDIRYQTDIKQRKVEGLEEVLKNIIPGKSQELPEKVDILGRIMEYSPNRLLRASKIVSETRGNEATRALREADYSPVLPNKTLSVSFGPKEKTYELKGNELSQFYKEMGAVTNLAVILTANTQAFKTGDKDTKKWLLQQAVEAFRKPIRDKWKEKYLK